MKNCLLVNVLCLVSLTVSAQTPPKSLTVVQKISLNNLKPNQTTDVVLNIPADTYWETIRAGYSVLVEIQLAGVSAAVAPTVLFGTERPTNKVKGSDPLLFVQDFEPGATLTNPFSVVPTGNKLGTLAIKEPPIPDPTTNDKEALLLDFCPDGPQTIHFPHGRSWAYIKPGERTRLSARHINPLRVRVGVDAEAVALNTDAAAARASVDGLLKQGILASAAAEGQNKKLNDDEKLTEDDKVVINLLSLLAISDQINAQLDNFRQQPCLTDALLKQGMLLEGTISKLLLSYPDEYWLDLAFKRMSKQVDVIAAKKKSPLKESLADLASYAKRDGLSKEIYRLLKILRGVPAGSRLQTPYVESDKNRKADLIRYTVKTTNLIDTTIGPLKQEYDVLMVGHVKFDYSAGPVLTFLADQTMAVIDEVVNQTLPVEGINKEVAVVRQRPVAEQRDKATLALATLGHLYWRTPWFKGGFNVGLTLGGGLTTKGRPVLLGGGSLLLGRQQRIVLSGGVAVGTQKELSARYEQTANYYASAPAETLTYIDRTRVKGFFGLTFNFGQNEKKATIF